MNDLIRNRIQANNCLDTIDIQFAFHRTLVKNYEKAEKLRTEHLETQMCDLEEEMIKAMGL
jgi:hypothetical protein